ncbi:MAG: STAS-like domain-containing protein [Proteobacteria bacterium]|nr:STAS-like domain-containing protein [Pseudomonadota bacterium]
MRRKRSEIIEAIYLLAKKSAPASVRPIPMLVNEYGLSRQQASRYIKFMCQDGILERDGAGRGSDYRFVSNGRIFGNNIFNSVDIKSKSIASSVESMLDKVTPTLLPSTYGILRCLLMDLIYRSQDWIGGHDLQVTLREEIPSLIVNLTDKGNGLFYCFQKKYGYGSMVETVANLAKGADHPNIETPLFRVLDLARYVKISANRYTWEYSSASMDWAVSESGYSHKGTKITLELDRSFKQPILRTNSLQVSAIEQKICLLLVALHCRCNRRAPSRSEARAMLQDVESFDRVVVDFRHVDRVGNGFLHEIFVVFQSQHPSTSIEPRNLNNVTQYYLDRLLKEWKKDQCSSIANLG